MNFTTLTKKNKSFFFKKKKKKRISLKKKKEKIERLREKIQIKNKIVMDQLNHHLLKLLFLHYLRVGLKQQNSISFIDIL